MCERLEYCFTCNLQLSGPASQIPIASKSVTSSSQSSPPAPRFTDIKTLFYAEQQARARARGGGGDAAAAAVHSPEIMHLEVNYRTHSGILDVASAIVDVLRALFPLTIDRLSRERAFLPGPAPLLLNSVSAEDLAVLLSWSDKDKSQVSRGAGRRGLACDCLGGQWWHGFVCFRFQGSREWRLIYLEAIWSAQT